MDYYIHNTSRSVSSRTQRYSAPTHRGLVQFLDGFRILRGRPLVLTEEAFIKNIDAIKAGVLRGQLDVRTADGRRVDPNTGDVSAPAKTPPLPVVVLDSAKNDKPSGVAMPIYPNGPVQSTASAPEEPSDDDEDVEVEHTESGSGAKRGRRRR